MDRWAGKVALVTGASAGIGTAISYKLVESGVNVIGCARNIDKLNQISEQIAAQKYSGTFKPLKCDVKSETDIKSVFEAIKSQFGRIDICINNAGLANNSPLISGNTADWKEMLDVNVLAVSIISREAIKLMLEKNVNDGQIINLNSLSGHRVVQSSPTHFYSATKFAVKALTEGLRQELRELKSGIRVAQISPGMVESEFHVRLFKDQKVVDNRIGDMKIVEAKDIAQIVIDILKLPNYVEIHDVLVRPTQQVY